MESIGDLQFTVDGEAVSLEVSLDESDDGLYYVVDIRRECFDKVSASLKSAAASLNVISSKGIDEDERNKFFPDNDDSDAVMSRVVIIGSDGEVFGDQKVNFKPRAYLKFKIPVIVEKVSALVRGVFDQNPDVGKVIVRVAVDGERIATGFEGVVADEETGEF